MFRRQDTDCHCKEDILSMGIVFQAFVMGYQEQLHFTDFNFHPHTWGSQVSGSNAYRQALDISPTDFELSQWCETKKRYKWIAKYF